MTTEANGPAPAPLCVQCRAPEAAHVSLDEWLKAADDGNPWHAFEYGGLTAPESLPVGTDSARARLPGSGGTFDIETGREVTERVVSRLERFID